MYRRPESNKHETLSDTLDYLHNNIEGIKKDLIKVATRVWLYQIRVYLEG